MQLHRTYLLPRLGGKIRSISFAPDLGSIGSISVMAGNFRRWGRQTIEQAVHVALLSPVLGLLLLLLLLAILLPVSEAVVTCRYGDFSPRR
jgi:hypothetical protein